MRTLIFCTAYAWDYGEWSARYRKWIDAVRLSGLKNSLILLIDDASPSLPRWEDVTIVNEGEEIPLNQPIVIYHFKTRLGRPSMFDFPGWYRSYAFAAVVAKEMAFDRVLHIESDAFLISERLRQFVNNFADGWVALWPEKKGVPESGLQFIAGSHIKRFQDFTSRNYDEFRGKIIENEIPFSHINKEFIGDRYGEWQDFVPSDADFTMQTRYDRRLSPEYFWWLPPDIVARPEAKQIPIDFDSATYLELNPDVANAGFDPELHYQKYGWHEGRLFRKCDKSLTINANDGAKKITPYLTAELTKGEKYIKILHRDTDADRGAVWQAFVQKQYSIPSPHSSYIEKCYENILAAGLTPLIIDAGANIGASAAWFSLEFPNARIVAIEPDQGNFNILAANTRECNVDLLNAALDAKDGEVSLVDPGQGAMAYRIIDANGENLISALSVHSVMSKYPSSLYVPFIFKIDIEGSESRVFSGDVSNLSSFPLIIVEPHDWMFPGAGTSTSFFVFHGRTGREFQFGCENVFSFAPSIFAK